VSAEPSSYVVLVVLVSCTLCHSSRLVSLRLLLIRLRVAQEVTGLRYTFTYTSGVQYTSGVKMVEYNLFVYFRSVKKGEYGR
jgi:hypothetical protein